VIPDCDCRHPRTSVLHFSNARRYKRLHGREPHAVSRLRAAGFEKRGGVSALRKGTERSGELHNGYGDGLPDRDHYRFTDRRNSYLAAVLFGIMSRLLQRRLARPTMPISGGVRAASSRPSIPLRNDMQSMQYFLANISDSAS